MSKPRQSAPSGVPAVDYRNKYSESKPVEIKASVPEDLVSGMEDYKEYLGECAGINTSSDKIIAESIKDTLNDSSFKLWREKKIREKAQKNKNTNGGGINDDDIEKSLDETFKKVENPPIKNSSAATNGATAGAGTAAVNK